jgi:hypothetical protein
LGRDGGLLFILNIYTFQANYFISGKLFFPEDSPPRPLLVNPRRHSAKNLNPSSLALKSPHKNHTILQAIPKPAIIPG